MKNLITKIIVIFIAVLAIILGFKVGDNALSNANASTNYSCGVNNGWIWNGTQCVNTCDVNHPWDPVNKRCSVNFGYYSNAVYGSNTNCAAAYGSNFYYDGKSCVARPAGQNANYYSNPFNGTSTNPVYSNINPNVYYGSGSYNYTYGYPSQNTPNYNYSYNYDSTYYSYSNTPSTYSYNSSSHSSPRVDSKIIYQNTWDGPYYGGMDDQLIKSFGRGNADYYIYIITTTTSQPKGTPIYMGTNPSYNYYGSFDSYDWYSYNKYNYKTTYDYRYDYNSYTDWYSGGYYDIYGNYVY